MTRDIAGIMKDLSGRLNKLEKDVYQDDDSPVERYISRYEAESWSEDVTTGVHLCPFPSDAQYPSDNLYPC